ncbi:hypothetical protein [Rhizosaccharibacter radicis]|uniref:Uncharacterized protein n=1 Tax=Rhizosaccharibacter radicis TaxID=2782605 RepID=A0ABT1VXW5_9PROT|nr:hypothetical protein [Acetobacteraceae bacterium KSS12]
MHLAATPRAGDVVACGRRWFVIVGAPRADGKLGAVLLRRGQIDRLRSHVVPDVGEMALAGLPMMDAVLCCDGLRWIERRGATVIGSATTRLLSRITITLRRSAEAAAMERRGDSVRSTIWRCPGGGRGRKIGSCGLS